MILKRERLWENRNNDRKENNSIRQQIRQLVIFIVFFMLGIVTVIAMWGVMNYREMNNISDQYLSIGCFIEDIKNTESALKTYIYSLESDDYQSLLLSKKEMESKADRLSTMEIIKTSTRQMQDIQFLIHSFDLLLEQMHAFQGKNSQDSAETVWIGMTSEEYHNSVRSLEFMEAEGNQIYTNAQTAVVTLRKQINTVEGIYLFLVFLVSAVLLSIGVIRAKKWEKSITEPVIRLTNIAKNILKDDIERSEPIDNNNTESDEIIVLTQVFNQMLKKLQKQVIELKRTAYLKESELKRLQSQINSHFLFNTMSMISQTAYLEDADKTVELIQTTAKFLRYSLDSTDKKVTLSRELDELGNYIFLQEKRFGDRIYFCFDLQEQYHDVRVPSLILQPLIENAISHGIGMKKGGGSIWIRTRYDIKDEEEMIQIVDNGEGIEFNKLKELKNVISEVDENISKESVEKIGLINTYKRLKLCYEDGAKLLIDSKEGVGTIVEIRIPYAER